MKAKITLLFVSIFIFISCTTNTKTPLTKESIALKNAFDNFPSIEKKEKHKILTLGTFHFDRSLDGSDVISQNHIDITSTKNQSQIEDLVDALKDFNPTRIAVEWPLSFQDKIDSLYQEYKKGNWELNKNEAFQIGFRLGKLLNHEKIYCVDNNPPMPESITAIDDIDAYAKKIGHTKLWHAYDEENLKFNTFIDTAQNNLYVMDYLKLLNSKKYSTRVKQIWTSGLVNLGYGDTYIGADFLGRWYRRNARIFANTKNLAKDNNENILVIYGVAHKWILDELYESAPDFELIDLKTILH